MSKPLVYVLNGPNMNLLGIREPHLYGHQTLQDCQRMCEEEAAALGMEIDFRQTNHEGVLIDWVQESYQKAVGIVMNPGAYARTSLALHTAVRSVGTPVIEVHITNIYNKESYRPPSYLSHVARAIICGAGLEGYCLGLQALHRLYLKGKS